LKHFVGIDFGTCNSSIAYVVDPEDGKDVSLEARVVPFQKDDGSEDTRLPSLVARSLSGKGDTFVTGWDAEGQMSRIGTKGRRTALAFLRHGQNMFNAVKSDLGASRVYPFACATALRMPEDAVVLIFREMIAAAKRANPHLNVLESPVVISVPASLSGSARKETLAAAVQAGLKEDRIELIDEPIAALLHALGDREKAAVLCSDKPRKILVFDYGGGTLDLCLVECRRRRSENFGFEVKHLAISHYLRNGGNDIDAAITENILWQQVEKDMEIERLDLSPLVQRRIQDTLTVLVARRLKEQMCAWLRKTLEANGKDWAKIDLKHEERCPLPVAFQDDSLPKPLRCVFKMNFRQFQSIMEPFVEMPCGSKEKWETSFRRSIFPPIFDTLAKAGLDVEDIDTVLYHGGSCRNPFIQEALQEAVDRPDWLFNDVELLQTPSLNTSVAQGAALACYWRKAKNIDPVRPIIAEPVGIMDRGGNPHWLTSVACSEAEALPYPSEDSWAETGADTFCIPEDGAPFMIVPWFTGREKRRIHWIRLNLQDHQGLKRNDPVSIEFRVDRDKVLHWRCRVNGGAPQTADSIDDPWETRAPTIRHRQLAEHRSQMKLWAQQNPGRPFPRDMLYKEANLSRLAGDVDTAELLSLEYLGRYPSDAGILNILSLMLDETIRHAQALDYSKRAVELSPDDAVFVGNYGYLLADRGQNAEAETMLRRALAINPDLAYVRERLGRLLEDTGRRNLGLEEYQRAVNIIEKKTTSNMPDSGDLAQASRLYRFLGQEDKAVAAAERRNVTIEREKLGGDGRYVIASYRSQAR
jgi:molecular chaperone DnaK